MKWKIVQASIAGTSHAVNGRGCDDECFAEVISAPDGEELFIGLVSDGAGNAPRGAAGAGLACNAGTAVIEEWAANGGIISTVTDEVIAAWVEAIRQRIRLAAELEALTQRDYACTLMGSVIGEKAAVFFQVGDGAIVINAAEDGLVPVFWPESGEYANMTYFVTDSDTLAHLRVKVCTVAPDEIAIFSDGIQRLALVYESKSAFKPFFEPMFETLRKSDAAKCDVLSDQLALFLNSPQINERTDDDKTLVLASRTPGE